MGGELNRIVTVLHIFLSRQSFTVAGTVAVAIVAATPNAPVVVCSRHIKCDGGGSVGVVVCDSDCHLMIPDCWFSNHANNRITFILSHLCDKTFLHLSAPVKTICCCH